MIKLIHGLSLSLATVVAGLAATSPIYVNNSPVDFADIVPQIDATAFVNRSTFNVALAGFSAIPYQTFNTLYFTNAPGASMSGFPGFRFDYFNTSNNVRLAMDTWENRGSISGSPWVIVMATNVINRGALAVPDVGLIRVHGTNVDLRRSTLLAGISASTPPPGGGGTFGTNHSNASGVRDLDWGAGLNNRVTNGAPPMRLDVPGFTDLTAIASPPAQYIEIFAGRFFTNLWVNFGGTPFMYTNQLSDDEYEVQVVFLDTNNFGDDRLSTDIRFVPNASPNGGADVIIAIESRDFDIISGTERTNGIYFVDHSAFTTNITLTWNGNTGALRTRRPSTYEVFRTRPAGWNSPLATNGNATFTDTTLYNPNMTTNFVTNAYAHYGFAWSSAALTNLNNPGAFPLPGRIEISGDNVNLDRTRIKAETTLSVRAQNLSSNVVPIVDAPLIDYDLGSTSPPLVITNLAPPFVRRFSGVADMWTGVWDTREIDPNDTNRVITAHFHVLIFEFFSLEGRLPVTVRDFFVTAEDVNISDFVNVGRAIRLDTRNLTVTGGLSLPFGYALDSSNLVGLVNFTNFGVINADGQVRFGVGETVAPLENFVIAPGGSLSAAGQAIEAASVQLGGVLSANAGGITIDAESVNLSGFVGATSDVEIRANTVVASNSFISVGAPRFVGEPPSPSSLIFDVPGTLVDAGTGAANDWTVHGGIRALSLPATGDLLGTIVRIPLIQFGEALVLWPSADLGASAAGFNNNLALGVLEINGGPDSLVRFEAVQETGAIYIDNLLLGTDRNNGIEIEPGMTVYFADSPGIDPTELDGLHGGRLRWVPGFAGPLSSTNLVYPTGETYTFNAALVRSMVLDSDGDGIVNALDSTPIIVGDRIGLQIATTLGEPKKTVISWMAPANSTSVIEFKDSLNDTTWQSLPAVENGATAQRLSISDVPPGPGGQRFYRVRTQQR